MTAAVDDESRWAEAQAVLDGMPPEPPHRQEARERYDRRAARVAVAVFGSTLLLALLTLVLDPPPDARDDPPTWRAVAGITVMVLGLGLFFLRFSRPFGSRPWIARPLDELPRRQRKELLQQVRGRVPCAPERLPLARLQARTLLEQRAAVWGQSGLAIIFVGVWIGDRSIWRTVLTAAMVAATAVAAAVARRDERDARRFLADHPAPDST